jgi:4-oxalocrotonate tautomerase
MPYIAIKAKPKDEATKKELVRRINQAVLEVWGCPQEVITISMEEIQPDDWKDTVVKQEIEPYPEKMMIRYGEKLYQD